LLGDHDPAVIVFSVLMPLVQRSSIILTPIVRRTVASKLATRTSHYLNLALVDDFKFEGQLEWHDLLFELSNTAQPQTRYPSMVPGTSGIRPLRSPVYPS
jgi:hypothetical protein